MIAPGHPFAVRDSLHDLGVPGVILTKKGTA